MLLCSAATGEPAGDVPAMQAAAVMRNAETATTPTSSSSMQDPVLGVRRRSLPGSTPIGRRSPALSHNTPTAVDPTPPPAPPSGADVGPGPSAGPPQPSMRILKRPPPTDASPPGPSPGAAANLSEPAPGSGRGSGSAPAAPVPPMPTLMGIPVGGILPTHSAAAPAAQQTSLPLQPGPVEPQPTRTDPPSTPGSAPHTFPAPDGIHGGEAGSTQTPGGVQKAAAPSSSHAEGAEVPLAGSSGRDITPSEAGLQPSTSPAAAHHARVKAHHTPSDPPSSASQSAGEAAESRAEARSGKSVGERPQASNGHQPAQTQEQLPQQQQQQQQRASGSGETPPDHVTVAALKAQMGALQKALLQQTSSQQQQLARLVHNEVAKEGKRLEGSLTSHVRPTCPGSLLYFFYFFFAFLFLALLVMPERSSLICQDGLVCAGSIKPRFVSPRKTCLHMHLQMPADSDFPSARQLFKVAQAFSSEPCNCIDI